MQSATQFGVFLINKPGVLAQVVDAIAEARINVVALTIVDSQEHGVLRVVGDDPTGLRKVLRKLNLPVHESKVLAVELPNKPGALASIIAKLSEEHVNIQYAYVTAGGGGGKTTGILKVDNLTKAGTLLRARTRRDAKRSTVKSRNGRPRR